jgi:hypothetical protein
METRAQKTPKTPRKVVGKLLYLLWQCQYSGGGKVVLRETGRVYRRFFNDFSNVFTDAFIGHFADFLSTPLPTGDHSHDWPLNGIANGTNRHRAGHPTVIPEASSQDCLNVVAVQWIH